MKVCEELTVAVPPQRLFDLYRDLHAWQRVLDDVLDVDVRYDDGYNQEFTMTVSRPTGPETVRGVRYCRSPRELEMVQFTTPPMLSRMSGRWTFDGPPQGPTVIRAERSFTLRDDDADHDAFARHLRGYLRTNLECFAQTATHARGPVDSDADPNAGVN